MTNQIEITELEAKARAATPGPWTNLSEVINGEFINYRSYTIRSSSNKMVVKTAYHDDQGEFDIPYIAAANPAAILSLIAELEQAMKDNDARQARIEALENSVSIDDFIREIEQCPGMKDKLADARKWLADQSSTCTTLTDAEGWICCQEAMNQQKECIDCPRCERVKNV